VAFVFPFFREADRDSFFSNVLSSPTTGAVKLESEFRRHPFRCFTCHHTTHVPSAGPPFWQKWNPRRWPDIPPPPFCPVSLHVLAARPCTPFSPSTLSPTGRGNCLVATALAFHSSSSSSEFGSLHSFCRTWTFHFSIVQGLCTLYPPIYINSISFLFRGDPPRLHPPPRRFPSLVIFSVPTRPPRHRQAFLWPSPSFL